MIKWLIIGSNFIGIMAKQRDTWVDAEEKEHSANENKLQNQLIRSDVWIVTRVY